MRGEAGEAADEGTEDTIGAVVVVAAAAAGSADDGRRGEISKNPFYKTSLYSFRVSLEHARGTPRGDDYWRDQDRGYYPPRRRGGRDK